MATIEIAIPEDWTPGQIMATRQLLHHAVVNACPVIACVRKDVTAEQFQEIYNGVESLIRDAGLQAS
jgi:hypothetical protein